jgi:hypothetical protein
VLGGGLGVHRFYLHGLSDRWAWLHIVPTMLGVHGLRRVQEFGLDDRLSWLLIPLLGFSLSAAMLSAIVIGLTPDERWNAVHHADGSGRPAPSSGWLNVLGVILALALGAAALMATLAFSAQRYFESQVETTQ